MKLPLSLLEHMPLSLQQPTLDLLYCPNRHSSYLATHRVKNEENAPQVSLAWSFHVWNCSPPLRDCTFETVLQSRFSLQLHYISTSSTTNISINQTPALYTLTRLPSAARKGEWSGLKEGVIYAGKAAWPPTTVKSGGDDPPSNRAVSRVTAVHSSGRLLASCRKDLMRSYSTIYILSHLARTTVTQ